MTFCCRWSLCENGEALEIPSVGHGRSGVRMGRFIEGEDRRQGALLPEYLDDYVCE